MYVTDNEVRGLASSVYEHDAVERRWQEAWTAAGAPSPTSCVVVDGAQDAGVSLTYVRDCAAGDAHARYRRATGEAAVLVLPAWDHATTGPERLGFVTTAQPADARDAEAGARVQRQFLKLLAAGRIYRAAGGTWRLRADAYDDENHRALAALAGWSEGALDAQRATLGRTDGVEVDGGTLDGRKIKLFAPNGTTVTDSEVALISPDHADIHRWVAGDDADARLAELRAAGEGATLKTGAMLRVEGIGRTLPLVVTRAVDARFGPTAILGTPKTHGLDRALVDRLCADAARWDTGGKRVRSRTAVRHRTGDLAVSRQDAAGIPVPVVLCAACGPVPAADDDLPVAATAAGAAAVCPACGSADAVRERQAIAFSANGWLDRIAAEPALTATIHVQGPGAARAVLAERTVAKALRDAAPGQFSPEGEPYVRSVLTGMVAHDQGDGDALSRLAGSIGADALRFTLLYAAAPTKSFRWSEPVVAHCTGFLERLWGFAEPRLREAGPASGARLDLTDPARRRLARWCGVAQARITENLELLQTHRATRNTMILLDRIEAFEARAAEEPGGLAAEDREAVVAALTLLLRLMEPTAPHIAHELWAATGAEEPLGAVAWPGADGAAAESAAA
jgi:leucyl-tRNA synthetase